MSGPVHPPVHASQPMPVCARSGGRIDLRPTPGTLNTCNPFTRFPFLESVLCFLVARRALNAYCGGAFRSLGLEISVSAYAGSQGIDKSLCGAVLGHGGKNWGLR